jgi:hypothetical protein
LKIYDDKVEYTAEEIHDLVNMIDSGNRQRSGNTGFSKIISSFGIVGNVVRCNLVFVVQLYLSQVLLDS